MRFRKLALGLGVALAGLPMAAQSAPDPASPPASASCRAQGSVTAAMKFPTGQASDVTLARSVIPALERGLNIKLTVSNCVRGVMQSDTGLVLFGGEDGEAFPRVAVSADGSGKIGAYLAKADGEGAPYALVVMRPNGVVAATRFYDGIPTNAVLGSDMAASLNESGFLVAMRYTGQVTEGVKVSEVRYGFAPPGGVIPQPAAGLQPDGTTLELGPQMRMADGSQAFVTLGTGPVLHKPSGLGCPLTAVDRTVMLADIQADAEHIQCEYRDGPGTAYQTGVRPYTLIIARDSGTLSEIINDLSAGAGKVLSIAATIPPPLKIGPAPAPQAAVFWKLNGGGSTGLWLGKKGDWIVRLQVEYDGKPDSEAKVRALSQELYAAVYKP